MSYYPLQNNNQNGGMYPMVRNLSFIEPPAPLTFSNAVYHLYDRNTGQVVSKNITNNALYHDNGREEYVNFPNKSNNNTQSNPSNTSKPDKNKPQQGPIINKKINFYEGVVDLKGQKQVVELLSDLITDLGKIAATPPTITDGMKYEKLTADTYKLRKKITGTAGEFREYSGSGILLFLVQGTAATGYLSYLILASQNENGEEIYSDFGGGINISLTPKPNNKTLIINSAQELLEESRGLFYLERLDNLSEYGELFINDATSHAYSFNLVFIEDNSIDINTNDISNDNNIFKLFNNNKNLFADGEPFGGFPKSWKETSKIKIFNINADFETRVNNFDTGNTKLVSMDGNEYTIHPRTRKMLTETFKNIYDNRGIIIDELTGYDDYNIKPKRVETDVGDGKKIVTYILE